MTKKTEKPTPTENDIRLINEAHAAVVAANQTGLEKAIECGEMLRAAKEKVGHSNWMPWLKDNCPNISDRTARDYMWAAKNAEKIEDKVENGSGAADLSIRGAKRLLAPEKTEEQKAAQKAKKEENKKVLADAQTLLASQSRFVPIEEHLKPLAVDEVVKALKDAFDIDPLYEIHDLLGKYLEEITDGAGAAMPPPQDGESIPDFSRRV
jgi:hypothetical protein